MFLFGLDKYFHVPVSLSHLSKFFQILITVILDILQNNLCELLHFLSQCRLALQRKHLQYWSYKGFCCMRPTRCWRYCVSDSLLGAISICISVKSFLCCDKPPLMGISVSHSSFLWMYITLYSMLIWPRHFVFVSIFSSEWWLFACCSHYFSFISPCRATCSL